MNREALFNLVALGEGFTVELKRSGASGLGREICAFANATGGAIEAGLVGRTIPDKPTSGKQEYWLTDKVRELKGCLRKEQ